MVDICGYEFPTNSQNFTQKDLTKLKIFQKGLGGTTFEYPVYVMKYKRHFKNSQGTRYTYLFEKKNLTTV